MNSYMRALSFLTILPLPFVRFSPDGRELSNSASCFPLAGATIGLLIAALSWVLLPIFPLLPVVLIALLAGFFLTRGLHFDGLADTADGLIGTISREKAFKAMDDSAIGVMGATAIFFVYLLKIALLIELGFFALPFALLLMPFAGRWAIVFAGAWFPPARDRGLGDLFLRNLCWPILLKASLGAALLLALFTWWQAMLAAAAVTGCLAALGAAYLLALYASRRLGGISGDILGAASELGELFFLIGFYLVLQHSGAVELLAKAVILGV